MRRAVLELTSAVHNWRLDPNPQHVEALTVAAWSVSGHALELESKVQALATDSEPLALCVCRHTQTDHVNDSCTYPECPCSTFREYHG